MTPQQIEPATDTADVTATIEGYLAAYNMGEGPFDMKRVERFYCKNRPLMIAIPAAPDRLFLSWEDYSAAWSGMLANFSAFFFTAGGDLVVDRLDRVAWASQTGRSHGRRADGATFERSLRQTLVLILDDNGAWRIAQEHVSLVAG